MLFEEKKVDDMKFLPRSKFDIVSHKSPETILKIIQSNTTSSNPNKSGFPKLNYGTPYYGELYRNGFHITPVPVVRNSFLPDIYGIIEPKEGKTMIHITMRLKSYVTIFLVFFTAFACLFFLIGCAVKSIELIIGPLGLILCAHFMTQLFFRTEINSNKELLTRLLVD